MKKALIALALLAAASPALAASFLVKQWFSGGNQYCQYDNGTVLNMGAKTCPTKI